MEKCSLIRFDLANMADRAILIVENPTKSNKPEMSEAISVENPINGSSVRTRLRLS